MKKAKPSQPPDPIVVEETERVRARLREASAETSYWEGPPLPPDEHTNLTWTLLSMYPEDFMPS